MGQGGAARVSNPWGRWETLLLLLLLRLLLELLLLLPLLTVEILLLGPLLQEGEELFRLEVDGVGDSSEAEEYPLEAEERAGEGSAWGTRMVRGARFS